MSLSFVVAAALKTLVATRAGGAITVDGVLDEPTWQQATFVHDFAQKEPVQDAPPLERTEVAVAFDGKAIYVAARMELREPDELDDPMTRRDDTSGAERFIVSFDPYRSRRTAYSFAVTAAGVRADWIHTDDDERARDHSWNPVWSAAARVDGQAWVAEMRIPLSQLRFPSDPSPVWGVNFNRFVPRRVEDDFWIVVPKDVTAWSSYFGELRGLDGIRPKLRLEILPYVAGDVTIDDGADPGVEAGADVKLGLGADLTLDATVNPDFGQVEADPAVVNLSAYEVTFPERRPFFVEGSQIFASQPRQYFYSRRIGAGGARILGAAKVTGQAVRRTNVAALAAVTGETTNDDDETVPAAGWSVLRVERELDENASVAGVTITGMGRAAGDAAADPELAERAVTGGVDLRLRPRGGEYDLFAAAGASLVTGDPAAITAIQTASAHYFQRPDAEHVEVDPDATSIAGWHADLRGARRAGHWRFDAGVGAESPGFELNDVGVLQSADDIAVDARGAYVETSPSRWLHSWEISAFDLEEWSFDGTHKPGFSNLAVRAVLPNFLEAFAEASLVRPGLSDDKTRGGPLMELGWTTGFGAGVQTSGAGAGRVSWSLSGGSEWSADDEVGAEITGSVLWRVVDRLRVQVAPRVLAGTAYAQYVTALDGTMGGADTFGTRYVFATLEVRETAVQVRAQVSLTPDLTIDAYVEPFASSGRFAAFGELPRPRARTLRRYLDDGATVTRAGGVVTVADGGDVFTFDDPDFTFLSLRSTVVLRWELRPGSTLFAVWQEDRSEAEARARGLRGDVLGDVFATPGAHVLAIKLAYWWSPY